MAPNTSAGAIWKQQQNGVKQVVPWLFPQPQTSKHVSARVEERNGSTELVFWQSIPVRVNLVNPGRRSMSERCCSSLGPGRSLPCACFPAACCHSRTGWGRHTSRHGQSRCRVGGARWVMTWARRVVQTVTKIDVYALLVFAQQTGWTNSMKHANSLGYGHSSCPQSLHHAGPFRHVARVLERGVTFCGGLGELPQKIFKFKVANTPKFNDYLAKKFRMSKYLLLMTEMPDLLQAGIPRDGLQCTEHLKYMVLNDFEEFGRFEADEKSFSRQMPRSQMSWKTLECPGSNQRHLTDRKIALYQLKQILDYKTDGSLVNFRRMTLQSTQKTTEDVDNGHSKECRSFDVCIDLHCNTFKIRFGPCIHVRRPTTVHEGAMAPGTRSCQTRTPSTFFFGPRKRGFVRTLRTPLGYVPAFHKKSKSPCNEL